MDLLELLDEQDEFHDWDDEEDAPNRGRRQYLMRRRIEIDDWDDVDYINRFRISKESTIEILQLIEEDLLHVGHEQRYFFSLFLLHSCCSQLQNRLFCRSRYIQPMTKLLIALRFFSCGSFQIVVADFAGVCSSSVCRMVKTVALAIAKLKREYIRMPRTDEELMAVCSAFYAKAKFPRTIGAIDCTHVRIQSPGGEQAETYRNRKGFFSLNCQTVSDANLKICNLETRWPGSSHDQRIFNDSFLCFRLERGDFKKFILVGDSGYKNTRYLATPFLDPATPLEELYNQSQIRTRVCVERSYGVLKRRFPCLSMGLRVDVSAVRDIITACCILHNVAIGHHDLLPPVNIDGFEEMLLTTEIPVERIAPSRRGRTDANTARAYLVNNYYAQLLATGTASAPENDVGL